MTYYRVNENYMDKLRIDHNRNMTQRGKYIDNGTFIYYELYTEKELAKFRVDLSKFDVVNVSRRDIYFSFGCRFQNGTGHMGPDSMYQ